MGCWFELSLNNGEFERDFVLWCNISLNAIFKKYIKWELKHLPGARQIKHKCKINNVPPGQILCELFLILQWNNLSFFLLVVCSFLRKITTMTLVPAPAHGGTKEPGGTMLVIIPILMACILMVHILLMPMASNGTRSEVTTILWNAQRWKLKPNSKSLESGSSHKNNCF